jgi:hypothetical protein
MIEEILDIVAESDNLIRSTLAARVVGIYPGVKYLTENPLMVREAIERVSEALEEDLGMDIQDKPSYNLTKTRYELKLRDIDREFSPLLSSRKEPNRCAALTAVTDSGEKNCGIINIKGGSGGRDNSLSKSFVLRENVTRDG